MTAPAALRGLSLGYAAAVDALDGPSFAALFCADGELWVPDLRHGPDPTVCRRGADELIGVPAGLARYHATYHRVGASTFVVDGDRATGEVVGVAHHLTALPATTTDGSPREGGGIDTIWYLTYEDAYRRHAGSWALVRRTLRLRDVEERAIDHIGPARRTVA